MLDRILVAEEHLDLLAFCGAVLTATGYEVIQQTSGTDAEKVLRTSAIDLLLTDLKLPGVSGLDLLAIAKEIDPDVAVILMTGFPAVDTAIKAMKGGAFDYLAKPFSAEELIASVVGALERRQTREQHKVLRSQLRTASSSAAIIGRSARLQRVLDDARRAAAVDSNVLITGETGVGKERVARIIHEHSERAAGPFVPVNCAAIPEQLLESEFFGYERGAFTGAHLSTAGLLETAHGGTLFLDELGEMNPALQPKLLRALEDGAVRRVGGRKARAFDVRFIGSTNRDIRGEIRSGRFREDLFYRIDVIEIHVSPLRDRREDIPLLATYFLDQAAKRRRPPIEGIGQEALDALLAYDWPGNIRELRNAMERAVAFARAPLIALEDLPDVVRERANPDAAGPSFRTWRRRAVERLEREFLEAALDKHQGNVSRTARALRLHRSTLQRVLRKHRLPAA